MIFGDNTFVVMFFVLIWTPEIIFIRNFRIQPVCGDTRC